MRQMVLVFWLGVFMWSNPSRAESALFSKIVKASLVFEEPLDGPYLRVYLRLEDVGYSNISWSCDSVFGIEAEMFDANGKPMHDAAVAESIVSGRVRYLLPAGSKLDWLISHGGMSGVDPTGKNYAVEVGGKIWWIPKDDTRSYALHVRLTGVPDADSADEPGPGREKRLVDLPAQKIVVNK
jgi:hypothetical protein